jgi:hypothetical protein
VTGTKQIHVDWPPSLPSNETPRVKKELEDMKEMEKRMGASANEMDKELEDAKGVERQTEDEARSREQGILSVLRKEHDLAKAVKSDNAAVSKHLWDIATCPGPPSTAQQQR